jgi:hypothetical protein
MRTPKGDPEAYALAIANAIDAVPAERETLFLTKLALVLALKLDDATELVAAIDTARRDC